MIGQGMGFLEVGMGEGRHSDPVYLQCESFNKVGIYFKWTRSTSTSPGRMLNCWFQL